MAVSGIFASDMNIVGTRAGDFAGTLLKIMPTGSAPLLALTSGMESADAKDTVVHWFEENHISGRCRVTAFSAGDGDSSPATVTVDDASSYTIGTYFLSEDTGEYFYCQAVSGNNMTLERAFAGTTATTIVNGGAGVGHQLQRIGTAFEEGSSRPVAIANLGYPRFNLVQIFRNAWDVTGTARAVEYITGDVVAKNQADCGGFHAEDIERALIWGRQHIGTKGSPAKPFRTMDGLNPQISTNIVAAGATTKWTAIDSFLQSVFQRNIKGKPNERIAFCGNEVVRVLNKIAMIAGVINLEPGQTEFGMKITKWMTPYGDISLMTHPLMTESPYWTKDLYVFHPGAIRTRYLRRTTPDDYDRAGTRAGVDADYGVLTTEMCVEYRAELTGGRMTGFTDADATQP